MFGGALDGLPRWLVVASALGLACTVLVTCAFVVGRRLFPDGRVTEGGRASGEHRRRAEIRRFLRAIEEPFAEDHPVGGTPVAFYLPARDVAITFDARAYYRLGRSGTRTVLVEHEMPGPHLADRLPFETPDVGFDAEHGPGSAREPAEDATSAAFTVLGVPTDASTEEVRRAYREKVKTTHPDHGGDRDAFRRVREAYTTAKEHAG